METSTNTPSALAKTLAAVLVVLVGGILIMGPQLTSSSAAFQERDFENKIPSHIPLKIKIKKEKERSFKDLKNEKWLREFELEVTNTGDRPIYYIEIVMDTGVKFEGHGPEIVFPMTYGRAGLGDIVTKATSDDVPIKPGETVVLSVGEATAWERGVRGKRWPEATKFTAEIQILSFGDGTGYWGTSPYPSLDRRRAAALNEKLKPRAGHGTSSKIASTFKQPAFMPANFSPSKSMFTATSSAAQPFVTCAAPYCIPVIPWTGYVCWDNNPENNACRIQNRPTPDQIIGECKELEFKTALCTAGVIDYECVKINVYACGSGPGTFPSPSPTPTPSPQPCQYCTDPNATPADCSNPTQPKCDASRYEYEQFGCCYLQTCERAGITPPPPLPCPPGTMRTSEQLQPFPDCTYKKCIPVPEYPAPAPCGPMFDGGGGANSCDCYPDNPGCASPIVIDVLGDGFALTDAAGGVNFDIRANGIASRVSWTTPNSDDAWLVLDRNGNGLIDSGQELFGNFSPQALPGLGQERNGFSALLQYDYPIHGGNGDAQITPHDAIFSSLRLWQDRNHNGISEPSELLTLDSVGLRSIELAYKLSKKKDEYGNRFRYRAKVTDGKGARISRWAWDVFLLTL